MIQHMRNILFQTKFSIAVRLVDSYTGQVPFGRKIKVVLENAIQKSVQKSDGYYVFADIPKAMYKLHVQSEYYMHECLEIDLRDNTYQNSNGDVKHIALIPNSSYPIHPGATILRATFRNTSSDPVSGVEITAVPMSEECARARVAQETLQKGQRELSLIHLTGLVSIGDQFLLKDKKEEKEEYCQISGIGKGVRSFELKSPIEQDYSRGALLLPVTQARSDQRGEVVLFFRNSKVKTYNVKLEMSYYDQRIVKEVRISAGDIHLLGTIELPEITN